MRPDPDPLPADARLRDRLFWCVLLGALGLVAGSHALPWALSYRLEPGQSLRHGGYGLGLATPTPRAGPPRVLLLGNSVYQHERLPELMQRLAELRGQPLELVNLAQVGSGLEDYLVQAAWTADQPRALTVICLGYVSLSASTPRFRTDAVQYAFEPRVMARLPASFYRRSFGAGAAASGLAAALFPHQRVDPILRHELSESSLARPRFLYDRLQFPRLNLGRNRIIADFLRGRPSAFDWWNREPEAEWEQAFDELLVLLRGLGPVLVIWQEARPGPYAAAALDAVRRRASARGGEVTDLQRAWDPERFRDPIHPTAEERPQQALRHLIAIERALSKAPGSGD